MNAGSGGLSRRTFLALSAAVVAGGCSSGDNDTASTTDAPPGTRAASSASTAPPAPTPTSAPPTSASTTPASTTPATTAPLASDPFLLGVSAGDPDETSAVLWTRLAGDGLPAEVDVTWELSDDESFRRLVATGETSAAATRGHSVHVTADLDGPLWYRFRAGGFTSAAGRVAPAPASDGGAGSPLRIAAASCQDWEAGYYAAHRDLASWQPDLVLFLGDFIYEYAGSPGGGGGNVRSHDGPEVSDLDSYRSRYALYLSDADLRAARAVCPWVSVWDDHEVENNYAALVPENERDAATFAARRAAAYQAWWEHMPVRLPALDDGADYAIYRTLRWGELAELIMLDGRQYRSDQACGDAVLDINPACPAASQPDRTMLGAEQERWLGEQLAASTATWPVIGQQTVLTDLRLGNGAILNYDQWDGYGAARERLLAQARVLDRLVVLTGDIHLAGVGVLPDVGVEFVTTSISSDGLGDVGLAAALIAFDHVIDAELAYRGYTRHTVTPDSWTAEFRIVANARRRQSPVTTWKTYAVDATRRDLVSPV